MGKCNLLKPLSSNNGNFFMFSQYSEDLTIEYTQKDTARVVPSKFIALNLNTYGLNDNTIAEIFQNYYENHCCYWRGQERYEYEKSHSWELLLQTLEKFNMISVQDINIQGEKYKTSPNIKYIGDINIYSNQVVDGMSYNEIYCYIPNDAKEQQWKITDNTEPSVEQIDEKIPEYILGFDENDLQDSSTDKYYNELSLKPYKPTIDQNSIVPIDYFQLHYNHLLDFNEESGKLGDVDSDQFEINTIIVLYDIIKENESVHSNLPMGIYFTGMITNGEINNPITKYVNNAESYDQGTSYGLRICTRYLSQVNIKTLQENIKIDTTSDGIYPENVTVLLSKLNESQLLMTDALNKTVENAENLKNHYNLFKTSKTNVPYIQNVNGEPYWFVNGKNTDVKVLDISKIDIDIKSIASNELNDVTINKCLKNGESVEIESESKYLDFNQLNNFAKSINSEFLSKNKGVTKQEISSLVTKEYVDNNFVKQSDVVNTDDFLTKNDAEKTYIPLSSQSSFVTLDKLDSKADQSEVNNIIDDVKKISISLNSKANTIHSHKVNEIDELEQILNGKAYIKHTHVIEGVEGLQDELDSKADKSDVKELQNSLSNYSKLLFTYIGNGRYEQNSIDLYTHNNVDILIYYPQSMQDIIIDLKYNGKPFIHKKYSNYMSNIIITGDLQNYIDMDMLKSKDGAKIIPTQQTQFTINVKCVTYTELGKEYTICLMSLKEVFNQILL